MAPPIPAESPARSPAPHFLPHRERIVQVAGATVTLTGTVHDRRDKRRAEDIAESVLGVKDVQNQIRLIRENG